MREKRGEREKEIKKRKREGDGFMGVEQRGYWGGQDLILTTLDRHECFSVFHDLQKDKQRKQHHSLKLGTKRRESSKRNYYIISPRKIIKAIIVNMSLKIFRCDNTSYEIKRHVSLRVISWWTGACSAVFFFNLLLYILFHTFLSMGHILWYTWFLSSTRPQRKHVLSTQNNFCSV